MRCLAPSPHAPNVNVAKQSEWHPTSNVMFLCTCSWTSSNIEIWGGHPPTLKCGAGGGRRAGNGSDEGRWGADNPSAEKFLASYMYTFLRSLSPCLWPCSNMIFSIAFDIVLSFVFHVVYPYYLHTIYIHDVNHAVSVALNISNICNHACTSANFWLLGQKFRPR